MLCQQRTQDHYSGTLVQRFVVVAALGRLNATRAPFLARALFNGRQSRPPKLQQQLKALLSDAHTTRERIVDEHLRTAGVRVSWCGQATNIQAIAHGEQR
jgi:hypothetical protein